MYVYIYILVKHLFWSGPVKIYLLKKIHYAFVTTAHQVNYLCLTDRDSGTLNHIFCILVTQY